MSQAPRLRDFPGGHIHMIGIGGSSMSGLARMLLDKGFSVSGSDRDDSYHARDAMTAGAAVSIGHRAENVHGADLVAYTAAIPKDNPELLEARRLGIPCIERGELLGQLMDGASPAIAVCGAHGKTTTTAMLAQILMACGKDPSIHIGERLDALGGSTRVGKGGGFLAEACEFNRSFLHMRPTLAVVLNIDADHLDCYRDIDEIQETFGQFLELLPPDGTAVGKGTDPRIMQLFARLGRRTVTFGLTDVCDWHPANYREDDRGYAAFTAMMGEKAMGEVQLRIPGAFNAENALAALAAAHEAGCGQEEAAKVASSFTGVHRRFEKTDTLNGAEIFHDYGHNPAEMRNAVSIARRRCKGRLIAVMQPHTFSRVKALFDDYLTCTGLADVTLVTDICAAREKDPGDINSGMLVDGMRNHGLEAVLTPTFDDAERWLRDYLQPGDLALTMGCGDINRLNDQIHRHEVEAGRAAN